MDAVKIDRLKIALAKATLKILKPLIQILMRHDISHGEFSELAKRAYVEVAFKHFSIPSRKTTYSRVAVLTGLSRKEVVRIVEKLEQEAPSLEKATPNRASRIISAWLRDGDFSSENNEPKVLPLKGPKGSFEQLVARYGGDITMGSIIEELERVGAISWPDQHSVKLSHHAYIPDQSESETVDIIATCASDLLNTAVFNIENDKDNARFQRQVVYHRIPISIAKKFEQYSRKKNLSILLDYNRWLAKHTSSNGQRADEPTRRIGVGIYYFESESDSGRNE